MLGSPSSHLNSINPVIPDPTATQLANAVEYTSRAKSSPKSRVSRTNLRKTQIRLEMRLEDGHAGSMSIAATPRSPWAFNQPRETTPVPKRIDVPPKVVPLAQHPGGDVIPTPLVQRFSASTTFSRGLIPAKSLSAVATYLDRLFNCIRQVGRNPIVGDRQHQILFVTAIQYPDRGRCLLN